MGSIIFRTSLFDPSVPFSLHSALDVLRFRVCPCADSHGMTHVLLQDFAISSYRDFHLYGVDVLSLR